MVVLLRTHTCGELNENFIDEKVVLSGWVSSKRDHGGVVFIDLRDKYGITQIVFEPEVFGNVDEADKIPRESVIQITGKVRRRPEGMENKKISTGSIEVVVEKLKVLSKAKPLPLETDDFHTANEDVRLKYRFLDLRRPSMQYNIVMRHKIASAVREYLNSLDFNDIETPFLTRSTPEGARDFLVPSRIHKGKFYALPQSPQLFKQLLMVSGFDKYYQIVKCFRDEDLRADRQPEFTQIDIEMSFVEEEDVFSLVEGLISYVAEKVFNKKIQVPFERITYKEAMENYGSDKPDVRFGLKIKDVSEIVKNSEFNVFETVLKSKGKIKALKVDNPNFSRKEIDEIIDFAIKNKAKGLAWMKMTDKGLESNIVKFFSEEQQKKLVEFLEAKPGDLLLFAADKENLALEILGKVRLYLGEKLNLYDKNEWKFLWVVDFPLVEWNEDEKRWDAMHHPFTSPKLEDVEKLETDIGSVRARAYDITMNGWEIGGGSIRIFDSDLQKKMFKILNLDEETVKKRFGWFLEGLQYGVPPHGGIAFGFDRFVALLLGKENIREVIAFPKNKAAINPMDESPSTVTKEQLDELGLELKEDVKKNLKQ